MKVTSTRDLDFPSLNWGIRKGETRDLPEDKEAQKAILASRFISKEGKKEAPITS